MADIMIETSSAIFSFQEGILVCTLKPDLIIDERTARRIVEDRLTICKGNSYPLLTLLHKDYLLLEKEAFRYFGSERGVDGVLAHALVIDSPLQKVITNFSLLFYKQPVPFRLFTQKNEALLWLFQTVQDEVSPT